MSQLSPLDITSIRQQFPALNQKIAGSVPVFFDGPGGTQVPRTTLDSMIHYLGKSNSNLADNPFFAVQETLDIVKKAREYASALINAPNPNNIVFGANMSSITAHVSRSIAKEWNAGDEIIVTDLDHFSNVSFWKQIAKDRGVICRTVRVNPETCTLDYDHFKSLISEKTRLVAFTLASNVSGSVTQPQSIIDTAKHMGVMTYVDAVHYTPHFLPDVQQLDCDFLVCSSYKFFGPHLGILYGKETHLNRLQPYKVEPAVNTAPDCWETGTKNFEGLAGLIATIDYLASHTKGETLRNRLEQFYNQISEHEKMWADIFLEHCKSIPSLKIWGHQHPSAKGVRTPTFAMTFKNHKPQDIASFLGRNNIGTGANHFYAQGLIDTLRLTDKGGVLRVGAMHYNTLAEIDHFFAILEQFLK